MATNAKDLSKFTISLPISWGKSVLPKVVLIFYIGLILRILFIPNQGFEADVAFWKSWGLAPFDLGMVKAREITNNNYPPPFSYFLWFITWVYSFFANPHTFNEYWNNNNLLYLTIVKLPIVLADMGIVGLILWVGKKAKKIGFPEYPMIFYALLGGLYFLNPVSITDGAWWGQVDALGVLIFFLAILAILTKHPLLAGVLYMTSMMTKLQNMIYGPVFFLFLWQQMGYAGLARGIIGAVVAFFGLNIEFFLASHMDWVIKSLTENYDYFPWMSLNAYNIWWIFSGARGMQVSDKLLALGMMNAKKVGLVLFSGTYLFAVLGMIVPTLQGLWRSGKKLTEEFRPPDDSQQKTLLFRFFTSLIVIASGFFLFQTESHDRYAFPISVFLLLWAPFLIYFHHPLDAKTVLKTKTAKFFIVGYSIFSLIYFYNLHTALVVNYPANGLPLLSLAVQPIFTNSASLLNLLLFVFFVVVLVRKFSPAVYLPPVAFVLAALLAGNAPLLLKKPVSLTKFTPYISQQGYGTRQTDMPVNAFLGFNKWSALSVQYSFFRKGIGTHAPSWIDYDIGGHFKRFSTNYGIDTQAGSGGTAVFEIYGDGKLLFRSDKTGRYDYPRFADVDITGVKKLGLVTTDAGDGKNDDHTDWLNPTLIP